MPAIADAVIVCPKCKEKIKLTDSLAAPMLEEAQNKFNEQLAQKDRERETALKTLRFEMINDLRAELSATYQGEIIAASTREAQALRDSEELRTKLATAQQAQAEALRKERELADRERELNLTIETRVTESLNTAKQAARTEADEANRLKLLEQSTLIQSLQTKIDDLKQKAEQGSQQMQGEVQELDLQQQLSDRFRQDVLGEVAKGVSGADVRQTVMTPSGKQAGVILYESKRTKNWSYGWLAKLREDGRAAKADILVLVSAALPDVVDTFDNVEGVWVCAPHIVVPLAATLRATLIAVTVAKAAQEGSETKAELVYRYLTGPQFRLRIEGILEAWTTMSEDLEAEKRAIQRLWAKRQAQIDRVVTSTTGLFGDLEGVAAMPEIEALSVKMLGGGE